MGARDLAQPWSAREVAKKDDDEIEDVVAHRNLCGPDDQDLVMATFGVAASARQVTFVASAMGSKLADDHGLASWVPQDEAPLDEHAAACSLFRVETAQPSTYPCGAR